MNRRMLVLGVALLISVAWSAWTLTEGDGADGSADAGIVQARVRPGAGAANKAANAAIGATARLNGSAGSAAPAARMTLELAQRPAPRDKPDNLFAAYSYSAPQAPVAAVQIVTPPPSAPPLPFRFGGRVVIDGKTTYLLTMGEEDIGATIGTDIGEFKLVEADPMQLVFLHGPSGQKVPMSIAPKTAF